MTKLARRHARQLRKIKEAFEAVVSGTSIREAARSCHLPLSTFHRHYNMHGKPDNEPGRPSALLCEEENVIIETLLKFAARGFPLTRERLLDAVELYSSRLPQERIAKLPCKKGRPGIKWAKAFAKRHKLRVSFGKPSAQEAKRFLATNAVNLVSYAAALGGIIQEHNIDDRCIANIDVTGFSPDKDRLGCTQNKRYGLRGIPIQTKLVTVSYTNRITLLPAVSASGHTGSSLWVLKWKRLPYRCVVRQGRVVVETLSDTLPRDSVITTNEESAAVTKDIFIEWSKMFVQDIQDLVSGGRKVLLLYNAYRSHMSLEALEVLEKGGVIAFALLAHTSGTTKPLDVGIFQSFKQNIHRIINSIAAVRGSKPLDIFGFFKIVMRGYEDTFIPTVVRSAFEKAGVHSFNPMKYLGVPHPLSANRSETIVSVQELASMLQEKQEEHRRNLGLQPVVMKRGFVDTNAGLNLTSREVMEKVAAKETTERKKRFEKHQKIRAAEAAFALQKRAKRNARDLFERTAMVYCFKAYGDRMKFPRSLELRRKLARERTVTKKAAVVGCDDLTEEEKRNAPWFDESVDQYVYDTP